MRAQGRLVTFWLPLLVVAGTAAAGLLAANVWRVNAAEPAPPPPVVARSYLTGQVQEALGAIGDQIAGLEVRLDKLARQEALPGMTAGVTLTVVEAAGAKMRKGPGLEFEVLRVLPVGTKGNVIGSAPEWYQLRLPDGAEGWIYGNLLKQVD